MNCNVFSNARVQGGCGRWFEVLLESIEHTGGTDVVAFLHNETTGERVTRLFQDSGGDRNLFASLEWLMQVTSLDEPASLLRSPIFDQRDALLHRA